MKIVKFESYHKVGQAVRSGLMLSPDEDKAMAEFRGFYPVAKVYALRIENIGVIDTLLEITQQIQTDLLEQKKRFVTNTGT